MKTSDIGKQINDKIILEMEGSLGASEEVIKYIIEEGLKGMDIRQTDDDKTFDLNDIEIYTQNVLEQSRKFISTMEYDDIIKQALQDKDKRIKELEAQKKLNDAIMNNQRSVLKKQQRKLDKIKEEVNIFNKLDVEYEMNDIDNILKFVNKLLWVLMESE